MNRASFLKRFGLAMAIMLLPELPRIEYAGVDAGPKYVYVDASAKVTGDGSSWDRPVNTLRDAFDAISGNDYIMYVRGGHVLT